MTPPPRSLAALALAVPLALLVALLAPLPAATAASTYLCTSYDGCRDRGYSHFGYKQANDRMYWRMYSGHNCTNYVAYRLVKGGMPNERPWSGSGNASNWGPANPRITDDTPMVGAVAWWRANVPGAGSAGHVAYVEKVISRRKIVVSEDSWGGDFHWRTITKAGTGWPSGFVHFDDREVRATTKPSIAGTPVVGTPVTVDLGSWTPSAELDVQWYAAGEPVAGATTASFTPTPEQLRQRLSVTVTATARGYVEGEVTTARTTRVARGAMATATPPTLSGTVRVDEVLELTRGSVSPAADVRTYRWYADGRRIDGADSRRLRLRQEHIRARITAVVVSQRAGYEKHFVSTAETARVAAGRFRLTEPFTLAGTPRYGRTLEVTPGTYTPKDATVTYTWLRNGEPIADAGATTYTAAADDVGERLSVRVDLTHTGYRDHSVTLPMAGRVLTRPELRLTTTGSPGKVVAVLRVSAPGVEGPSGQATVHIGRNAVTGQVVDGRLRVVLRDVERGRHTVRAVYAGTGIVLPETTRTTVRVPRH